eukprot:GFYU01000428.1.p1 GENE.GFYU01000428.1~~GFYU01000428.1.p1  ORF type:complete len:174 (-),score=56.14 GFYU01000428.1:214-687(-)
MADQIQKAFQKQESIFLGSKRILSKKASAKQLRYTKDVGLGFKTPADAKSGNFVDKKCPFTGGVSIRGRILRGIVATTKMDRTITVRRDYLHYITKYNRYEKRHAKLSAHCSPAFRCKDGDTVTVGQCRPIAKTVRFNVIKVDPLPEGAIKKRFQQF